jgi:hypothetical protein
MYKIKKERYIHVTEALITGAVAIVVCMINNYFQSRESQKKNDKTIALIDYKISELTKRVDKHNNVVERTYKLEEEMCLHDEKLRVANHRIEDLEEKEK